MRHVRQLAQLLVFAGLLLAVPTTTFAQNYDHDEIIEQRFDVAKGSLITLDADMGSVVVEGTKGNEVVVNVLKGVNNVNRNEAQKLFERYAVSFDERGRGLEIIGEYDKPRGRINWRKSLKVHYEILVPEDVEVDLKTSGGSIHAENIAGDVNLKTSGGSLQLRDLAGRVTARTSGGSIQGRNLGFVADLHTSGGSINIDGAGGAIDAKTSGGSISIADVDGTVDAQTSGGTIRLREIAGAVNAKTSGGSIEAEVLGQPKEDMRLQTSGGSVTIHLDDDVRADLDAKASGGSVSTDFAVTIRGTVKKTQLQGEINGGGPLLTLRTSGGSVKIREN